MRDQFVNEQSDDAAAKSTAHSTQPTRLKRNVRFNGRRTTIVLEPYVWDCIDAILERENLSLDDFCEAVNSARVYSSQASAARMVVLAYFRILDGLRQPPFYAPTDTGGGAMHEPGNITDSFSVLPLAIRRFALDEANG
jgi:predicted DNA-binding ribbon-helix-helix protein